MPGGPAVSAVTGDHSNTAHFLHGHRENVLVSFPFAPVVRVSMPLPCPRMAVEFQTVKGLQKDF